MVRLRAANRAAFPDWHNAPVPSAGASDAPLLVVGLAPGLRGANRTGLPFVGDAAGGLLRAVLRECGLDPDGGRCRITNAVRCVPPGNLPTASELAACRPFLAAELGPAGGRSAPPRVVLCLGGVAHRAVVRALGLRPRDHPFAHGAVLRPAGGGVPVLAASYHPSRYNLNTGRLTAAMLAAAVRRARALLPGA